MNQALPIYLLSLARAAERRASISAHLQALGLEYELVDGVDGRALPAEEHAPGRSRFTAILAPRGAGVAMTSLHSMISPRRKQRGPAFASLRRQEWFPTLRDTLRLCPVKGTLLRRRRQREGRLATGPRWRLPLQGRE
jgi:hypothetical protein